jgi:rubrerythrin
LIRERNQFAHASGKILDEENIDKTIQRYNVLMDKIQNKSSYVVESCFKQEEGKYFEFLEEGNQVDQDFTINIIEPFCSLNWI